MVMAAAAPSAEIDQVRLLAPAEVVGQRAALGENASLKLRAGRGQESWNGVEPAMILAPAPPRQAAQQSHRIGMARIIEQIAGCPLLHQRSGVEHADAIAHAGDD